MVVAKYATLLPVITIRLPYDVPYCAQVASPELARAIFVDGLDPTRDPRWAETGAASPEEYAYWVDRACGIACVKMCVEALGGLRRPIMDWAREGLRRGGYLVTQDGDGRQVERGWVHRALAELISGAGFPAEACPASLVEIVDLLRRGRLVIASVSYELGDGGLAIARGSGHLVVVTGAELAEDGPVQHLILHNPSGRCEALRINARIPAGRFCQAYSGRIIAAG